MDKAKLDAIVARYEKNQERSERYLAKQRVILRKAKEKGITATEAEVDAFVGAVEERMHGHIRKVERATARREPVFRGFEIR